MNYKVRGLQLPKALSTFDINRVGLPHSFPISQLMLTLFVPSSEHTYFIYTKIMKISIYSQSLLCYFSLVCSVVHGSDRQQLRGTQNVTSNASNTICRVIMVDTMFGTDSTTSPTKQVSCIPVVDWRETDDLFPLELPKALYSKHKHTIHEGKLMLSISDSKIADYRVLTLNESQYNVIEHVPAHYRSLQATNLEWQGTMTFAVIRISTSDATPQDSASTLLQTYTSAGDNFISQYDECSFGKLKWEMKGNVYEVKVDKPITSYGSVSDLVTDAQIKMKSSMGVPAVSDLADKVLMCLPPGTGSWAASAGVKHWRVQLNDHWCRSLSGGMHELGHTMGLLHAHADGIVYNDRTGYMGSGYTDPDGPKKCFNAYNSYQFGWYESRHFDISLSKSSSGYLVNLATFVDFEKTTSDESVLINVNDDLYLLYNRRKGFNIGTEQKHDQITITKATTDGTDSVAGLSAGDTYAVSNFLGLGTLIIEACKTSIGANGAEMMLTSIAIGKSLCGSTTNVSTLTGGSSKAPTKSKTPVQNIVNDFLDWLMAALT